MDFHIFPGINIDVDNFKEDVKSLIIKIRPKWNVQCLNIKKFTAGVSNFLFGVYSDSTFTDKTDVVLVRIYGSILLDRDIEMENMAALSKYNIASRVFGKFDNGCSYQYIHGSMITLDDMVTDRYQSLIIKEFVKLHSVQLDLNRSKKPFIFDKMREMADRLPADLLDPEKNKKYLAEYPNRFNVVKEIECLEQHLNNSMCPVTFCHNDVSVNNMILNVNKDRIHFIDFEYADYNYCAFDIGNYFCEFAGMHIVDYSLYPEEYFQKCWIRHYLEISQEYNKPISDGTKHVITEDEVNHWYKMINKFALASHLFWSIWSILQSQNSTIEFHFLEYALLRWNEFRKMKLNFLTL